MYEKIQREIQAQYYVQNFPNEGQRFVAWYLRNIHLRDMIETKDDITDGQNDKQIDAIVVDDDKQTVFIIQGKFYNGETVNAEPLRETLSSWIQLRDVKNLQTVGNAKLQRKLSEFSNAIDEDYSVCFELVTTSELTTSANNDLATFQIQLSQISENDHFNATISLIDGEELQRRYDLALDKENPSIKHSLNLLDINFMPLTIAGTNVVLATIPLKECIKFPGIKDGSLFQKNVRQSLGLNAINKGIRSTILGDKHKDFFFFHNGITAICNKLEIDNDNMILYGLSVVNGCQSLNTILNCSETVKKLDDTYVLFRFYEIPQRERADRISINTNSQSSVKPRDLRSNDKRVLSLKKIYEQKYTNGYFIRMRGETAPADKDENFVIDLSDLGKHLIAWYSQRPNISYGETKIFDKYFEILFKKDYLPEDIYALNFWMKELKKKWTTDNPLGLNESLLAMKAYAPFHHLYAISMCFAISNNLPERVPSPSQCLEKAQKYGMVEEIIKISGTSLNMALEVASNEAQQNRVFSPQNWIKAKTCLAGINGAIRQYFAMLPMLPGGQAISQKLKEGLVLDASEFGYRLAAD